MFCYIGKPVVSNNFEAEMNPNPDNVHKHSACRMKTPAGVAGHKWAGVASGMVAS